MEDHWGVLWNRVPCRGLAGETWLVTLRQPTGHVHLSWGTTTWPWAPRLGAAVVEVENR